MCVCVCVCVCVSVCAACECVVCLSVVCVFVSFSCVRLVLCSIGLHCLLFCSVVLCCGMQVQGRVNLIALYLLDWIGLNCIAFSDITLFYNWACPSL